MTESIVPGPGGRGRSPALAPLGRVDAAVSRVLVSRFPVCKDTRSGSGLPGMTPSSLTSLRPSVSGSGPIPGPGVWGSSVRLGEGDAVQPVTASESQGWTMGSQGHRVGGDEGGDMGHGPSMRTLCPHCVSRVERSRPDSLFTRELGKPRCQGVTPRRHRSPDSPLGGRRNGGPGKTFRMDGQVQTRQGQPSEMGPLRQVPTGAVWGSVTPHTWPPPALPAPGGSSLPAPDPAPGLLWVEGDPLWPQTPMGEWWGV